MKASRLLILAAAAVLVMGTPALAFHDGGVAACNGCHTMHNSSNGVAMNFNAAGIARWHFRSAGLPRPAPLRQQVGHVPSLPRQQHRVLRRVVG